MDTYINLRQHLENAFLIKIYGMVLKSKVCPESTPDEWLKTLSYMHDQGWLYYHYEDGKPSVVIGAYRIKEFTEDVTDVMPTKEEGNILYVSFAVSHSNDRNVLKKMLGAYIKEHPDLEEIILYERNSDEKLKRIKLRGNHEQEKDTRVATSADVPSGT